MGINPEGLVKVHYQGRLARRGDFSRVVLRIEKKTRKNNGG